VQSISEICARRPVFATMLCLGMVVIGLVSYSNLGVDLYPKIDLPSVVITTLNPGAGPSEMESEVTSRIEAAVNTVNGVAGTNSSSSEGLSTVAVVFDINKNGDVAAQEVRDRVSSLPDMPETASTPKVEKLDPDAVPILRLTVSSTRSLAETSQLAQRLIQRRLEKVSGVGQVTLVGGINREIRVVIDPDRLRAFGLTVPELSAGIRQQNVELPGGRVDEATRELTLRTMGSLQQVKDLPGLIVSHRGERPIALREVADVVDGSEEPRGVSRLNGSPAISLFVMKQSGQNTTEVIDQVKQNLADIKAGLPKDMRLEVVGDQSIFIRAAIDSIKEHLIYGSLFAALVVLLFLRNFRATLIGAIAIPVSLIATFALIDAAGYTLNQITMLALALMVGIVIDDAIVVLENISHTMVERKLPPLDAAIVGTREITLAVLATTFSLLAVFLPVGFMRGIVGRFLSSFGLTCAFAVLISMIVSFTLTPAMCAHLLRPGVGLTKGGGLYAKVEEKYMRLLAWSMSHRLIVALACVVLTLSTVPLGMLVGKDFRPVDDLSQFDVSLQTAQGSSLAQTLLLAERIAKDLRQQDGITDTLTTVGGSEGQPVNQASIYVRMKPLSDRSISQLEAMANARKILARYPSILRPSVQATQGTGAGGGAADVEYVLTGPDLNKLNQYATELVARARRLPQATDVSSSVSDPKPELRLAIDRARGADLGVSAADIAQSVNALVAGQQVSTMNLDDAQVPIRIQVEDRYRSSAEGLRRLVVPSSKVGWVSLGAVASIHEGTGPAMIQRLDRQRQVSVTANVLPGGSQAGVSAGFQREIQAMKLDPGYRFELGGTSKQLASAVNDFGLAFGLAFVFMYMVLAAQFESFRQPFIILMTLPLSVPCGLLGLLIAGQNLNIYSGLGVLLLFGVVKKNAILQMAHTNDLRRRGVSELDAIFQSNKDRLRPILMTTLALVAGMLPLVFATGPGASTSRSLGVLVAAGQTFCLVLTLIMVPVFYSLFEEAKIRPVLVRFTRRFRRLARIGGTATLLVLSTAAMLAPLARHLNAQARPGIIATSPLSLTLQEAIELALANNPDLKISRLNLDSFHLSVKSAQGAFDPVLSLNAYRERRNVPVSSALAGGANGRLSEGEFTATPQITGILPWFGSNYSTSLLSSRQTTQNLFTPLSPQYPTTFNFTFVQPLVRGRRIDAPREQLMVSRKNVQVSESQLRQRVLDTVTQVANAYWDLYVSRANLDTQRTGRSQARRLVESTQRRANLGLQAQVDVIESKTQESSLDEAELAAEDAVNRAENALKNVLFSGPAAPGWASAIVPITPPTDELPQVTFEAALEKARKNAPELEQISKSLEISGISQELARDQVMPQVNLIASYTSSGLAGIIADRPPNPIIDAFGGGVVTVPPMLVGGYGKSLENLLNRNFPTVRLGLQFSIPIRNRTAEAGLANALLDQRRLETQLAQTQQAIETDVRNSVYSLVVAGRRLTSARASSAMAQDQYASEIRRFQAGLSSVFLVNQRQTTLLNTQFRYTQVLADVNKAIAGYYRSIGELLEQQGVHIQADKIH
jgi:HAE1 family hydrophobic/amphiphilic exporter-1